MIGKLNIRKMIKKNRSILHVGNIAHNAHYNAKSIEPDGYCSDIIVHDYYHYASCPEWLLLDVSVSDLGDDFFPNFFQFDKAKKLRPLSFSQGPSHIAMAYLWFKRSKKYKLAQSSWCTLQYKRLQAVSLKTNLPQKILWSEDEYLAALENLSVADCFREELNVGFQNEVLCQKLLRIVSYAVGVELGTDNLPFNKEYLDSVDKYLSLNKKKDLLYMLRSARRNLNSIAIGFEYFSENYNPEENSWYEGFSEDIVPYLSQIGGWRKLAKAYDERIFYSTHSILGFLTDVRPYAAYEHGTIRSIPFEESTLGRLTSVSFTQADACFITNADYLKSKPKLPILKERQVCIPHGFDMDESEEFLSQNSNNLSSNQKVTFLAPARHDWLTPEDGNSKGNDKIIYAIKMLVDKKVTNFAVEFIDYGHDTDASKELIQELNISEYVIWLKTLTRQKLWSKYLKSNAVLDQFVIPAIGAIGVEVLALGRRLINADNGSLELFFNTKTPILSANSVSEIACRMEEVISDPLDIQQIGESGRTWFKENHSDEVIRKSMLKGLKILEQSAR